MERGQYQQQRLGTEKSGTTLGQQASSDAAHGTGAGDSSELALGFTRIEHLIGDGPESAQQNRPEPDEVQVYERDDNPAGDLPRRFQEQKFQHMKEGS